MIDFICRAIGLTGCTALAIVMGFLFWIVFDVLLQKRKARRIAKMKQKCGPCVHLHFSRHDNFACDPHYHGCCTPETRECYYPSDY